ncbi:transcriptional regulator, GntR family [Candidatus Vecturithrix granuli]|uniref:Transcriptional regulator, GntR family n=1 Tax=Vecturithrix granuli TaxID=1499967 RepID=A0A0S6W945_VECG1|nr:transcriptional regulator, GntR family [Candidatus Vecturithrix granuli]
MVKEDLEERAYRSIIRMILEHCFKPGDYLLETELAAQLELSRTPVRQALGRLVAEGFLEKRRKKGCVIPVPTPEDAQQVFFARQAIESQTAAAAALHATDEDIATLQTFLQQQDEAYRSCNKEAYSLANEEFHLGIARASRNAYLQRYCQHVFWRSNLYIFFFDAFYLQNKNTRQIHFTPQEHNQIIEAIVHRNPQEAEAAVKQHIQHSYDLLFTPWNT